MGQRPSIGRHDTSLERSNGPNRDSVTSGQAPQVGEEDMTLIDCIPNEIQTKIAEAIMAPKDMLIIDLTPNDIETALSYSALCTNKKEVLRHALGSKMTLTDNCNDQRVKEMLAIMGNNARELDISQRKYCPLPWGIGTQNVRVACIRSKQEHLSVLRKAKNLKVLCIYVDRDVSWKDMLATLRHMAVEELTLRIHEFLENRIQERTIPMLPRACSEVKKLSIRGFYNEKRPNDLWPAIIRMPKLESLYFQHQVDEVHIPFLRTLKEVDVDTEIPIQYAARIGTPMITINDSTKQISLDEVSLLRYCPSVRNLNLRLENGAEIGVLQSVVAENLEVLELAWGPLRAELNQTETKKEVYEPDPELLLQIVKPSQNLKLITLQGARIEVDVILKILEMTGKTLTFLCVFLGEGSEFASNLMSILKGAVRYCTKIMVISPLDVDDVLSLRQRNMTVKVSKQMKEDFRHAVELLKKVSPKFREGFLRMFTDSEDALDENNSNSESVQEDQQN